MEDTTTPIVQVEEGTEKTEITTEVITEVKPIVKPEKESKWYVLRVVSGKERKIKEYLDKDIVRNGWDKLISQIFLPTSN